MRAWSIILDRYFTLLNMFGEFPLIERHNEWGRVVGTFAAVFAVAVFSVPVGILGDGFADAISEQVCKPSRVSVCLRIIGSLETMHD
eukprot:COSAG05_NODE_500_length_9234_cov_107.281664_7_plen_87_part_00